MKNGCLYVMIFGLAGLILLIILANLLPNQPVEVKELKSAQETADAAIAALDKKARAIPAWKFEENLEAYEELLELKPNNYRYKNKVNYYTKRVREAKETGEGTTAKSVVSTPPPAQTPESDKMPEVLQLVRCTSKNMRLLESYRMQGNFELFDTEDDPLKMIPHP